MTKTTIEEYLPAYSKQLLSNSELAIKCNQLEKKLEIATKALKEFKKAEDNYLDFGLTSSWKEVKLNTDKLATKALKEMEKVE